MVISEATLKKYLLSFVNDHFCETDNKCITFNVWVSMKLSYVVESKLHSYYLIYSVISSCIDLVVLQESHLGTFYCFWQMKYDIYYLEMIQIYI